MVTQLVFEDAKSQSNVFDTLSILDNVSPVSYISSTIRYFLSLDKAIYGDLEKTSCAAGIE